MISRLRHDNYEDDEPSAAALVPKKKKTLHLNGSPGEPLPLDAALAVEVAAVTACNLQEAVAFVDTACVKAGYPKLHQKEKRTARAYYHCACHSNCFKVVFSSSMKGAVAVWSVFSVGARCETCEPVVPFAGALANSYIPQPVKSYLVTLFDSGIGPSTAHEIAVTHAFSSQIPLTWEGSDVKNFFGTLRNLQDEEIINLLKQLPQHGHSVRYQLVDRAGKRTINRFIVVFVSMHAAYKAWGSLMTLDATYGKNWLQFPLQLYVGLSGEGCIVPFAVGCTRFEQKEDYLWQVEQFYEIHGSLPPTVFTDGDSNISDAFVTVAALHLLDIVLLLCIWHLFGNIEKQLASKGVDFDPIVLKAAFYKCVQSANETVFEEHWAVFVEKFGTNDRASTYLNEEVWTKRERWVRAWTGRHFQAFLTTTGIGEAFNAFFASAHSANSSLSGTLVRTDNVIVLRLQDHERRAAKFAARLLEGLAENECNGFVLFSVSTCLSGYAMEKLLEINTNSSYMRTEQTSNVVSPVLSCWTVTDLRFAEGGTSCAASASSVANSWLITCRSSAIDQLITIERSRIGAK